MTLQFKALDVNHTIPKLHTDCYTIQCLSQKRKRFHIRFTVYNNLGYAMLESSLSNRYMFFAHDDAMLAIVLALHEPHIVTIRQSSGKDTFHDAIDLQREYKKKQQELLNLQSPL